jgi:hypothetical protein
VRAVVGVEGRSGSNSANTRSAAARFSAERLVRQKVNLDFAGYRKRRDWTVDAEGSGTNVICEHRNGPEG